MSGILDEYAAVLIRLTEGCQSWIHALDEGNNTTFSRGSSWEFF